ncbi:MAG: MBOAT family protein [Christensenellaceae bacterium]|nr:MBOAT family protein [Christensenellaceae bacterium]
MAYTSFAFLLFLAVVVLFYYIIPKRFQWVILLLASYAFYLTSGVKQVAFIIATTVVTYVAGLLMQKKRDAYKKELEQLGSDITKEQKRAMKKAVGAKVHTIQVLAVLINLGILAVIKYANFVIENLNGLFTAFKWDASIPLVNIIVPLGISFYTFQTLGYLIDVGRGKYDAERHFGRLALFVSFFPSIVQGPINRYDDLGAQFKAPHKFDYTTVKFGVQLMLWGLFKKLVIADRVYPMVSAIFSSSPTEHSGGVFLLGMLAYALQIYTDFSGGIDIARGAAQTLGINLPQNFERPYFSQSVAEYWRRWHASLGGFMRDYVFYPVMLSKFVTKISKSFRGKGWKKAAKLVPSVITPFVVFFLIGIWHGASWQYVAFGLYNAIIVAGSVALDGVFKKGLELCHINTEAGSWKFFKMVRTFFVLGIAKMLVKGTGLKASLAMIGRMFTDPDFGLFLGMGGKIYEFGVDQKNMTVLLIAVLVLLTVSILQEKGMKMRETISRQNLLFRWLLYIGIIVVILVFGVYGPAYDATAFIYQAY